MYELLTIGVVILSMITLGLAAWRAAGYGYREVRK